MVEIRRNIIEKLKIWKEEKTRKPILLKGARQIGKTWVMETFGRECFQYCAYFNFDRQEELKSVFRTSKSPERIIKELTLYTDVPIIASKTLIVFDEIQECEEAFNSLKYFCEEAPNYHIIAAGSLLGVAVKRRRMTVPVGKVQIERMFPISFKEYLKASDEQLWQFIEEMEGIAHLPEIVLNKLKLEYRRYMVTGGMPEAVKCLLENRGMAEIDKILQDILDLYELDFAQYAETRDITRIHAVWHSLPSQLGKENRKFIYKVIKPGARAKEYEDALMWLEDAGMIYRIYNITKPALPLSAYTDVSAFKIYACDCGLLRRLAKLPANIVLDNVANYTEFKGSMAENAVLQSLMPSMGADMPYYWSSDSRAEIEFVIQWGDQIIPIEVKSENCISGRSLSVYHEKFHPNLRIRFSFLNLQKNDGLLSCPTPLAEWISKFL